MKPTTESGKMWDTALRSHYKEMGIREGWKMGWKEGWKDGWKDGIQDAFSRAILHLMQNLGCSRQRAEELILGKSED